VFGSKNGSALVLRPVPEPNPGLTEGKSGLTRFLLYLKLTLGTTGVEQVEQARDRKNRVRPG
jgi:hypothetical protein